MLRRCRWPRTPVPVYVYTDDICVASHTAHLPLTLSLAVYPQRYVYICICLCVLKNLTVNTKPVSMRI